VCLGDRHAAAVCVRHVPAACLESRSPVVQARQIQATQQTHRPTHQVCQARPSLGSLAPTLAVLLFPEYCSRCRNHQHKTRVAAAARPAPAVYWRIIGRETFHVSPLCPNGQFVYQMSASGWLGSRVISKSSTCFGFGKGGNVSSVGWVGNTM